MEKENKHDLARCGVDEEGTLILGGSDKKWAERAGQRKIYQ
jgi:hypothetical protein